MDGWMRLSVDGMGDTATVDGALLESNPPLPVSTSTSAYKHEELRGRMFATPRTEAMNMITYCPDESCAVGRLEKKLLRPCPHFEVVFYSVSLTNQCHVSTVEGADCLNVRERSIVALWHLVFGGSGCGSLECWRRIFNPFWLRLRIIYHELLLTD